MTATATPHKMEHWKNISLEDIPGEEWREVVGCEGYLVSSHGRIKSCGRNKWQIIKQRIVERYLYTGLIFEGKQKQFRIHRLVAKAFLQPDELRNEVNHIDGNKLNNHYTNLEWCNRSENTIHSFRVLGQQSPAKGKYGKDSGSAKAIMQKTKSGEIVKEWDSSIDVERVLGFHNTCISRALHGRRKSAFGYKWEFKEMEVAYQKSQIRL